MKYTFLFLFFLILISKTIEQEETEIIKIKLNETTNGTLKKGEFAYYSLQILNDPTHPQDYLIIKLEHNSKEFFSDPDMFISDTEKYPSLINSNWSCTRYGNEIIPIHNSYIKKGKTFYISVTCENKCSYSLTANFNHIIYVPAQQILKFQINKGNSMMFSFKTKTIDYEHLSFQFLSADLSPYIIYISNNGQPSSSNTFKLRPAWLNGYIFDVRKNNSNTYCKGCEYQILIEAPEYDANIRILVAYVNSDITIKTNLQVFDSVVDKYVKCYNTPMKDFNEDKDSFILSITLFTGSLFLKEYGFIENDDKKYEKLTDEKSHHIITEKLIVISKDKINSFKEKQQNLNKYDMSFFHYCVGVDNESTDASYLIGGYFSSQTQNYQRLNMLMIGKSVKGYLPKKQVTKYKIIDLSSDSDISINLDIRQGNPLLYAYFNENSLTKNPIIDKLFLDNLIKEKKVFYSVETFNGFSIRILNQDNICHKTKNGIQTEVEKLNCAIYAIVYCENSEDAACQFRITAVNRKSSSYIIPKTMYYGSLMKEEKDSYNFGIYNENIESVTIVLNTLTGNTNLTVTAYSRNKKDKFEKNKKSIIFEPSIITISTKDLNSEEGIQMNFDVNVIASIYSTYSLYYYTTNKKKNKKDYQIREIDLVKEPSEMIRDIIPNENLFNVYMFEINSNHKKNKEDLIISLSKSTTESFSLYLFDKFSDFEYTKDEKSNSINIKGFILKNDYENMIIFENSNKYFKVGKFYLFVVRDQIPEKNTSENVNDFDIIYMRVSMKNTELILIESFIQSEYFYTNYNEQFYYYNHLSIDLPFSLSLNLYYGKIDIYIDFKEITKERVNNSKNQYFYLKHFNVEKSDYIKIPSESIKERCLYSNNCPIYIYIKKVGEQNVKFDIIALSRTDEPILLNQGKLIRYEIHVNEKQKYIIKDIPEEIDGKVMIRFEEGDGRVNMTFQCEEEDKDNYLWQAETDFYGKILKVPSYKTLDTADLTCYYSIYIIGTDNSFKSVIKYTIIYNYYADEIALNEPIKSHIKTGEIHYYTFSIDENENSLYISLYCSDGDSDLYVNYGKTLPTIKEYNWFSSNPQFDYVQINKNDNYFISNGLSNIGGIYTLMIYGFIESSYSLFVTSHPKKIIPLKSNSPSICQSKGKNEIDCFFRFDNLITSSEIDDIDIVFSVNFIYGVGDIFVNLVNNIEGDIFNKFPSRGKSDYSNTQRNKRNFLKIHIEKTHYKLTRNSILLIGVDCLESCFFEINSAILEKNKLYHYLDVNRQNLFYLEKNSNPFTLSFYKTKELNLNYEINSYTGEAEVLVYQNISTYNEKSNNYSYEYVHLGSTLITKNNPYYNFIIHHKKDLNQKIYFKITPKQNIGFYIQLNYESEWTRVPIGKEITYQVTKNIFNGYFDLFEEYNSTILSVRCNDEKAKATIFSTINIYKRNAQNSTDKTNPFNFLIPDNKNAQYKGTTDPITRSVSIKIKNVNFDDIDDDGNVRVLFSIHLKYNESNSDNIDKSISIIISPFVNYYKRIEVNPLSLYYSSDEFYIKEKSIYELKKIRKNDNIFVIELSTCKGSRLDASITDKLEYYFDDNNNEKDRTIEMKKKAGRYIITAFNMNSENYYLKVNGKEGKGIECRLHKKRCQKEADYMLYYYTTNNQNYYKSSTKSNLVVKQIGRGKINVVTSGFKKKDIYGHSYEIENINYKVFVSTSFIEFSKMSSLCYLTRMTSLPNGVKSEYKDNNFIISGLTSGELYYINILIENPETGELLTFNPISIEIEGYNFFSIILAIIIIILLLIGLLYYQRKYFMAEKIIQYERADIMNMAKIPQLETVSEMASIVNKKELERQKEKYTKLTDNENKI